MSYAKPIWQCQDAGIGIGEMNKLLANQLEVKTALELEHVPYDEQPRLATSFGSLSGGTHQQRFDPSGGQHDTPKVARGTMTVVKDTVVALGQVPVRVVVRTGVCTGLLRITSGEYFVTVVGLSDFYAEVISQADTATPTRLVQQTQISGSGAQQPGIYISTWEEQALTGNLGFALSEFGFHVVVYGRRGSEIATTVAPAGRPTVPFARKPRRFIRFPNRRR